MKFCQFNIYYLHKLSTLNFAHMNSSSVCVCIFSGFFVAFVHSFSFTLGVWYLCVCAYNLHVYTHGPYKNTSLLFRIRNNKTVMYIDKNLCGFHGWSSVAFRYLHIALEQNVEQYLCAAIEVFVCDAIHSMHLCENNKT